MGSICRGLFVFAAPFLLLLLTHHCTVLSQETFMCQDNGQSVGNDQFLQRAGPNGPALMQDVHFVQKFQRFLRERVPERSVHARGTGAHGYFVSTVDLSPYTRASVFSGGNKKTDVFVRFSTNALGLYSPEPIRDARGFATKFYTDEGNLDLLTISFPVFAVRDPSKFVDLNHAIKPSPITNLKDPNRAFDFFSNMPETLHQLTFAYSDLGIPANYRFMNGFGINAFKFINSVGQVTYFKFQWQTVQGVRNFTAAEATIALGQNFNNNTQDLYDNIKAGNFPSWDLQVQMLSPAALNTQFNFDPLDATKIWFGVPFTTVGRMTLNKLPGNNFQETEQSAFSPSNLVPGIQPSEDILLQGRLFAYADAQIYRCGANGNRLPINRPRCPFANFYQDGVMNDGETTSDVNYNPSSMPGALHQNPANTYVNVPLTGSTQQSPMYPTDDFGQIGITYRSFSPTDRDHLISNLAGDLLKVTSQQAVVRMVAYAYKSDVDYGTRLGNAVNANMVDVINFANSIPDDTGNGVPVEGVNTNQNAPCIQVIQSPIIVNPAPVTELRIISGVDNLHVSWMLCMLLSFIVLVFAL